MNACHDLLQNALGSWSLRYLLPAIQISSIARLLYLHAKLGVKPNIEKNKINS